MIAMTNRQRMLAAYRREQPDQVPVSPELWYDMGLLLAKDCTVEDFCFGRYPLWKLQRSAHRYFGSAAWLCAGPGGGAIDGEIHTEHYYTPAGELEFLHVGRCARGTLQWRVRTSRTFYDWMSEHPIKDLKRDLPVFEQLFLPTVESLEMTEIKDALAGVGDEGIVTAYVGDLFFSFIASHVEGGPGVAVLAMLDDESLFRAIHEKYVERIGRIAERIIDLAQPEILMIHNGYSTAGIINPAMYAQWDLPVLRAAAEAIHRKGKLVHLHQHGKCGALMNLIVSGNPDLVEPFERPPSGDTPDLERIKAAYGNRIAIRGNMHAHDTLLRGSPDDVEAEARQCIESAGPGGGFILASGDGVIVGTPHENIFRMVEAGEKYGKYTG
jgi:uroporphyrinogen-III decarboxylase